MEGKKDLWANKQDHPGNSSGLEIVHFSHGAKKGTQSFQHRIIVL